MVELRQRPGLSGSIAALALAFVVGCKANDTTGMDETAGSGAGSGGRAGGSAGTPAGAGSGGNGSAGRAGSASAAGAGAGSGAGAGGTTGSAGQGGSGPADAGTMADAAVPGAPMAQDPECDMTGIWIARLTTFSRDSVFNGVQTASNWFYYELEQDGTDVTVKSQMDCGIQVSGDADVTLNRATTESLLTRNEQSAREVTFEKDGDRCKLSFARFYSVRGAARATYLPADLSSNPALSAITPALPTQADTTGSEDWDGDGSPGIAYQVANLGTRHVAQRDWNEFFSNDEYAIALDATEFVAAARFDSQEGLVATSGPLGGLLGAAATPIADAKHRVAFRRLGRSADDEAVKAVRVASAIDSCYNVQDALPHDSAKM